MAILDDISGWLSRAGDVLSDTGSVVGDSWQAAIDKLKSKAREFADLFSWLHGKAGVAARDPEVKAEYDRVMNRGAKVKAGVEKTTGGIDWFTGQLKQKFGLDSRATMGALPMIPIAVIAAAVAAMTAWLADAYKLKAKITYLETHGITGSAAVDALNGTNFQTIIGFGAIAAAIYFLTRQQ